MEKREYAFFKHIKSGLIAGLIYSLGLGFFFGVFMVGINKGLHDYKLAYPFILNFIPLYLFFGIIFGLVVGLIGSLLLRKTENYKRLHNVFNFAVSWAVFLLFYFILGNDIGGSLGFFVALLVMVTFSKYRPALVRVYFAVFFTAVVFYYTWQWARWEFIVYPLLLVTHPKLLDLGFMLIYSFIFLLGFRVFMGPFFNMPVKTFYAIGVSFLGLLLLAGGVYYFVPTKSAQALPVAEPKIERQPVHDKLLILGIDGMWWDVMDPLMAEGKMPNVKALVDSGSSGPLETLLPTFSAMIWTSMTTGKSEAKHHVTSFLVWKFPISNFSVPCHLTPKSTPEIGWMKKHWVIEAPITNQFLDTEPVWNMLSDNGASVGTVNWWVSWPADHVNGFVVTDHCLYNKSDVMQNYKSKEGLTPYDIYPVDLLPELVPFSHSPDDISDDEIRRFINVEDSTFIDEFRAIHTYNYLDIAYEASMFKYSYPEDVTYAGAAEYLLKTQQPDFMAVYLKGVDSMEHQYLKYYFADEHPDKLIPKNTSRYRDLINNYYIYMDEVVGRLVAAADSNTTVMIVSDHGFDKIMLPTGHYNHMNKPPGVFICAGHGIKKGYKATDAHVYDITPTALYLLGFPVAEDFDGKALTEITLDEHQPAVIPTYETGHRASRKLMESDIDKNYKDRLRALGYTQ